MTAYTYSTLTQRMLSYSRDTEPEYEAEIPNLIAKGEARVYDDLGLDTLLVEAPQALLAGQTDVDKPTNCIAVQAVLDDAGVELYERSVGFINRVLADAVPGQLTYWAELTTTKIRVAPPLPAGGFDGSLKFRDQAPEEQLSATQTTTWVSTVLGDLLLESCLWAAETYNKHAAGAEFRAASYAVYLTSAQARLAGRERQSARS